MFRVIRSLPPTYILHDLSNEEVLGGFYGHELLKTTKPRLFEVEEVLKTRTTKKAGKQYYVKFKFYPSHMNEWISAKDLVTYKNRLELDKASK